MATDLLDALESLEDRLQPDESGLLASEQQSLLNAFTDNVTDDPTSIATTHVYRDLHQLLKNFEAIQPSRLQALLDAFLDAFAKCIALARHHGYHYDNKRPPPRSAADPHLVQAIHADAAACFRIMELGEAHYLKLRKQRDMADLAGGKQRAKRGSAKEAQVDTPGYHWPVLRRTCVQVLRQLLDIHFQILTRSHLEMDALLNWMVKSIALVLENSEAFRDTLLADACANVLATAARRYAEGARHVSYRMISVFLADEAAADWTAGLVARLAQDPATPSGDAVIVGLFQHLADREYRADETREAKAVARFLLALVDQCPKLVMAKMLGLVNQLDSEHYLLRCAMVDLIGILIRTVLRHDREDAGLARLQSHLDLLLDRCLDINAFVRARVVAILQRLLYDDDRPGETSVLLKSRAAVIAQIACRLRDKSFLVRKAAVRCLTVAIEASPYRLDDGSLSETMLSARRDEIEQRLLLLEETVEREAQELRDAPPTDDLDASAPEADVDREENEELHVLNEALRKDYETHRAELLALQSLFAYYDGGLQFSRQIALAGEFILELLGSKNKTEVICAIQFFVTAHRYEIACADKGVRAMIHKVWDGDNTSTAAAAAAQSAQAAAAAAAQVSQANQAEPTAPPGTTAPDEMTGMNVRDTLLKAYYDIYLDPSPHLAKPAEWMTAQLIRLCSRLTLAERTSLVEVLRRMTLLNWIGPDVIARLWDVFADRHVDLVSRRAAIMLLSMMGSPAIIASELERCLRVGLTNAPEMRDYMMAECTCSSLLLLETQLAAAGGGAGARLAPTHVIFGKIQDLLLTETVDPAWFGFCQRAVDVVYRLFDFPDKLASHLINALARRVFHMPAPPDDPAGDRSTAATAATAPADGADSEEAAVDMTFASAETAMAGLAIKADSEHVLPIPDDPYVRPFALAQLCFLAGRVAVAELVYLEAMEAEWKRRQSQSQNAPHPAAGAKGDAATGKAAATQKAAATASTDTLATTAGSATEGTTPGAATTTDAPTAADGEIGQVVGSTEDEVADLFQHVREHELLFGTVNLLAVYGPILSYIVSNNQLFNDSLLQNIAATALLKFMCISRDFCESHLPLILTVYQNSQEPDVRSNMIIGLGDVTVCFNALIDQNIDLLYKGLEDRDPRVKKCTLMVLTHLILNGMIKLKGQMGHVAKCLIAEDRRISDLAKLFFTELSTKDNVIYNHLPDIMSHLSADPTLSEDGYQTIMRFLLEFIKRDKQADANVEKLCGRFRNAATDAPRQWRDVAFCLTLLPVTEKSSRKINETMPLIRDKLWEPGFYRLWNDLLVKHRKNAKSQETKTLMEEAEAAALKAHEAGIEARRALQRANRLQVASSRQAMDGSGTLAGSGELADDTAMADVATPDMDESIHETNPDNASDRVAAPSAGKLRGAASRRGHRSSGRDVDAATPSGGRGRRGRGNRSALRGRGRGQRSAASSSSASDTEDVMPDSDSDSGSDTSASTVAPSETPSMRRSARAASTRRGPPVARRTVTTPSPVRRATHAESPKGRTASAAAAAAAASSTRGRSSRPAPTRAAARTLASSDDDDGDGDGDDDDEDDKSEATQGRRGPSTRGPSAVRAPRTSGASDADDASPTRPAPTRVSARSRPVRSTRSRG